MLGQRRRRWSDNTPTLGRFLVLTGYVWETNIKPPSRDCWDHRDGRSEELGPECVQLLSQYCRPV